MEKNNCIENIELRSEEVQEIMGQIPSWILRWGITVIMIIILLFFAICYMLKVQQSLTANITLTSMSPPVELHANTSGKFMYMDVKNNELVREGDILAVINNPGNYKDLELLKTYFYQWKNNRIGLDSLLYTLNNKKWELGELENNLVEFKRNCENYIEYINRDYYPQKIALKRKEYSKRRDLYEQQKEIMQNVKQQTEVSRNIFVRDSILYSKNIGTKQEYDKALQAYLQSKLNLLNSNQRYEEFAILEIQEIEAELELQNSFQETSTMLLQSLMSSATLLEMAIQVWEEKYVLRAPIDGLVNLMGIWSPNQYIMSGETVLIIIPNGADIPLGKALLSAVGAGKVKEGQEVRVRLNNFPDNEYGFLKGRVSSISSIPNEDGFYIVNVIFPEGLITSYEKTLPPSRQMLGNAQIVIDEKRLIEKFLGPIGKLINFGRT